MKVNVTQPLDANDAEVEHAMKVIGQLTPAQRDEIIRSTTTTERRRARHA